jgi:hypothetical protein
LGWDQIKDETLWCTQKAMAQLFGVGIPAISKHLNHIWERELTKDVVVSKMEIVTQHAEMHAPFGRGQKAKLFALLSLIQNLTCKNLCDEQHSAASPRRRRVPLAHEVRLTTAILPRFVRQNKNG